MKKILLIIAIVILATLGFSLWHMDNSPSEQVLLSYTPNFDDLTLEDLPNLSDYRNRYEYNGHVILTGLGQIIEYDEKNNSYVRVSDPRIVGAKGCVLMGSAKIDNYIFMSCRDYKNYAEDGTLLPSSLYKIDLKSGTLLKKYFGQRTSSSTNFGEGVRANLWLAVKNRNLWMSSSDGVEVMDIDSEKITTYTIKDFSENECWPSGIFNDNGIITLTLTKNPSLGCYGDRVVIFDEQTNKWLPVETDQDKYIADHNFKWTEPDLDLQPKLPFFIAISEKKDEEYYILAKDGVYSLHDREFPKKIIDSQIDQNSALKSLFSKDGRFVIFLGQFGGEIMAGILAGYIVDLEKLEINKITSDIELGNDIYDNPPKGSNYSYSEENGKIYLQDKMTDKNIISIDLTTGVLDSIK